MNPDRLTRPEPGGNEPRSPETGPVRPDVDRPAPPNELLKRMKRVDPDQAKKYRQRSGQ